MTVRKSFKCLKGAGSGRYKQSPLHRSYLLVTNLGPIQVRMFLEDLGWVCCRKNSISGEPSKGSSQGTPHICESLSISGNMTISQGEDNFGSKSLCKFVKQSEIGGCLSHIHRRIEPGPGGLQHTLAKCAKAIL